MRLKNIWNGLIIALIAVAFDWAVHYFLSSPMETWSYFLVKFIVYSIYATIFLIVVKRLTFVKIALNGILLSFLWGAYYNIIPNLIGYLPYGISLKGLTFLGSANYLIVGLAFGITHAIGFILGVYGTKAIRKM